MNIHIDIANGVLKLSAEPSEAHFVSEVVATFFAKYEDPKDPRDIAMELLTADTANTRLKDMNSDSQAVNEALTPQKTPGHDEEQKRIIDMIAKNVNAIRGER